VLILTAPLIVIGCLLASFGTWIFTVEAGTRRTRDADPGTLLTGRRIATAGRWPATAGVLLAIGHGGSHGTPMILMLLAATATAVASTITKANLTTPAGNQPTTT
jgi:hypothetical protein